MAHLWSFVSGLLFIALSWSLATAATITVDPAGGGDFTAIQPAIDAAASGDTVLVEPGEYVVAESISFKGKAITLKADGGPEKTTIRMSEAPADPLSASVVVFASREKETSILEGFTITGGKGTKFGENPGQNGGGGVLLRNGSSPAIRGCRITGNSGADGGGVLCVEDSSPVLEDCSIDRNISNVRPRGGGGLACIRPSSAKLTRCTISENSSEYRGGGFLTWTETTLTLIDCTICGNAARLGGGGAVDGTATLQGCRFLGNSTALLGPSDYASAFHAGESPSILLENCTVAGNCGGPAIALSGALNTLENCTIAGNTGGGLLCDARTRLVSCIVWDNQGGSIQPSGGVQPQVSYSSTEGDSPYPGPGNLNVDPLFCGWGALTEVWVDPAGAGPGDGSRGSPFSTLGQALDFSLDLCENSPCLRAGEGGANMGAPAGTCKAPGRTSRLIHLAPGTCRTSGISGASLSFHASIEGAGAEASIIEGGLLGLRTGARLSGVTVTRGWIGGVLVLGESPEISGCSISGNPGGGLLCMGGSPTVKDSTISGNSLGGVVGDESSSPTLTDCTISGNSAPNLAGAPLGGGVRGPATLLRCIISGNSAEGSGGGVHGPVRLVECTVSGNRAGRGGGGISGGKEIIRSTITRNHALSAGGGGLDTSWDVTVEDSTFTENYAEVGGAMIVGGSGSSESFKRCKISGNVSTGYGQISAGGGVYCRGGTAPVFEDCEISGNWALWGGGVYSAGASPRFLRTTISANWGSGIHSRASDTPTFTSCAIWGNSAGDGGGLSCQDSAPVFLNCTIAANSAGSAGGVFCAGASSPVFTNCIVRGNSPESDSLCGSVSHCLVDADPRFRDLGELDFSRIRWVEIGGLHHLLPDFVIREPDLYLEAGSPAIDAGTSEGAPETDLDGSPRPCGAGVDIGSYEVCAAAGKAHFRRGDSNADGTLNIADPVALVSHLFGSNVLSCLEAADADANDALELTDAVRLLGFLFLDSEPPEAPFRQCGPDLDAGPLTCERYEPCE